jgi:hypothetical protein
MKAAKPPGSLMRSCVPPEIEEFRKHVLRVVGDAGHALGSAFGIGPRIAVTCHHCIADRAASHVKLLVIEDNGTSALVTVNEIILSPDPTKMDIALLRLADDLPGWIPVPLNGSVFQNLSGFGFPGTNIQQSAVRIDVEFRGLQPTQYANYSLSNGLILAGDPATYGMSGGPVIDATAGVAVGMIVGGPDYDGRTIAVPFHQIPEVKEWPAFWLAMQWNCAESLQRGWALNLNGAREICRAHTLRAMERLGDRQPVMFVPRQRVAAEHVRFLQTDKSAMVLIGPPNVGKSYVLATLASQAAERSLFFDAFRLGDCPQSLVEQIDESLHADSMCQPSVLSGLAAVFAHADEPLVVYLDAINEMRGEPYRVRNWFMEAISDCRAMNVKLVASCRLDVWEGLAVDEDIVSRVTISEFSDEEAVAACALYGLEPSNTQGMAQHPLFFRIASKLSGKRVSVKGGWFGLIEDFVKHLIGQAPHMSLSRTKRTFEAVQRVASNLGSADENISWQFAANQLGGADVIDSLITVGLFKAKDFETIRFAFDQIVEALRPPIQADIGALSIMWQEGLTAEGVRRRLVASVLRTSATGNASKLNDYVESLRMAVTPSPQGAFPRRTLNDRLLFQLGEIVASIISALPDDEDTSGDRLFDIYLSAVMANVDVRSQRLGSVLETQIAQSRFMSKRKAGLLVAVLPFCRDFDLRLKDLRGFAGFQHLLADAAEQRTIAGALLRLAQDDVHLARRELLPLLSSNQRLVGDNIRDEVKVGEVTVGELIGFILEITADRHMADLIDGLLENPSDRNAASLLKDVAGRFPTESLVCALAHLDGASARAVMDDLVHTALLRMGPGRAPRAVMTKLREIVALGTADTRIKAAELIRVAVPDDLVAWDILNAAVHAGENISLRPVPKARALAFNETLIRRQDRLAINEMTYESDPELQTQMAETARIIFQATKWRFAREFGLLAESKLYRCSQNSFYEAWLGLAHDLLRSTFPQAKSPLRIYAISSSQDLKYRHEIWEAAMTSGDGDLVADWVEDALDRHRDINEDLLAGHIIKAAEINLKKALEGVGRIAQRAKELDVEFGHKIEPELVAILHSLLCSLRNRNGLQLPASFLAWRQEESVVELFASQSDRLLL